MLYLVFQQSIQLQTKANERPLFPCLYLIIVNNYRRIMILNDSLNPTHPIVVAQVKVQPKDHMRIALPYLI